VLISGEAGVGKTRLAEEFAHRLRWQGTPVLWGRCYEFERVLPYQPVTEALRTILPTLAPAELADFPAWTVAEVARLVPEVLERDPKIEASAAPSLDQERTRLFEGVARFLARLSSHGALLVVLEDLHWASESTLQLLHYLTRHLSGHAVLILGTLRPEATGKLHPLWTLQQELSREGLVKPLHLSLLSPAAVEAMVVEMSGAGEAAMPLARRLYRETEGNPFFLMEIVKALFEAGTVRLEEGAWRGDFARISTGEIPLPASVTEAIQARARGLKDKVQEALCLAAILGREFDFDLLNAVWGWGEESLLEALDSLLRRRLIEEGTGAAGRDYAFTHHKIQEVVYAEMPRRRQQHAHARVGAAMEGLHAKETEAIAGELAFHFEQARQLDKALTKKAITYLLLAGDQARMAYAHEEAIDHYGRGLVLLREQGEHERAARTLMKMGLTHHNAFNFRQARQAYDEGFALWQRAGEAEPVVPLPPAPHALRIDRFPPPTVLDQAVAEDVFSGCVIEQLFSGLVELDPEMDVVPDVARNWEVLEGGRKYVFHLRDDVRWSDGAPVTAGDFEYAWKRVLDPATSPRWAEVLYDVKGARAFRQGELSDPDRVGVRALDEVTLVVELERPTGYFLHLLTLMVPAPRHVVEAHGERWTEAGKIVTNGPFALEAWQPGESMVLVRNPAYHGRFTGNVERVELCLLPDWSARLEMYEADGLDVLSLYRLPPPERNRARQRHAGEYISVPEMGTFYVAFDVGRPPFDDVRVRRAFVLAMDRETLADVVSRGYVAPATGGFVPPGMPGHSAGIGLPYDPDQARQLLAEAGYPDGRGFPPVEALVPEVLVPESEYLQAQWRENLGVEIPWEAMEWSVFLDRLLEVGPPHVLLAGYAPDYPDPDSFLRTSSIQRTQWRNEAYDGLVEEARRVMDQRERMRLYRQADKMLVEKAPIIPLTYSRGHLLAKPWVKRYATSPMGIETWFGKDVIIEPH